MLRSAIVQVEEGVVCVSHLGGVTQGFLELAGCVWSGWRGDVRHTLRVCMNMRREMFSVNILRVHD